MLKKNNFFFKKLEKFKKNKALILENSKYITYNELLLNSKIISKQLPPKKKLISMSKCQLLYMKGNLNIIKI